MPRPRLALVPGEPAGVGPELCARALLSDHAADLVLYGDPSVLHDAAAMLGIVLPSFDVVDIANPAAPVPGQADSRNAASVIAALESAARDCLDGRIDGMVTGPVHKATMSAGLGIAYSGTTDLLARQAGCDVVMMLARPGLRVALATTHLPLRAVPDAITHDALETSLRVLHAALHGDFGIASPVIAVLGLNPHAGEDGVLGREELEIIEPVLAKLRAEGFGLRGPLPADTAFLPAKSRGFDAVLAMYHDQGLPVLKAGGFEQAVNITLGLPYPRVAVDHGTALDIAGMGVADPSSLIAAIAECARMATQRQRA